jgi:hypothetical protein
MSRRQVWKKEAKLDTVNGGCWICPVPWPWEKKTIELGMKRASRENEEVPADRLFTANREKPPQMDTRKTNLRFGTSPRLIQIACMARTRRAVDEERLVPAED